ncbi:MAG TPA: hypothetical protein VES89_13415, partial [Candidatus Competibacteraceae bacterium]|nr:hypothetical protein [Candidatus Competibacteraceae bacterium]
DYAVVIFERIGGVIAYDISNLTKAKFVQYINNRNFTVDPSKVCQKNKPKVGDCALVGDLGPESVLFIPQGGSPIRDSLLILTHETSDTVSIYRVEQKPGHGFGYGRGHGNGYDHN